MTIKHTEQKRRRALLKQSAMLMSKPKVWATPLLSTVVLPVHAQTSGTEPELNILEARVIPSNGNVSDGEILRFTLEFEVINFLTSEQGTFDVIVSAQGSEGGEINGEDFALNAGNLRRLSFTGTVMAPTSFNQTTVFSSITIIFRFFSENNEGSFRANEEINVPVNLMLDP